jgi:hypothetical protein
MNGDTAATSYAQYLINHHVHGLRCGIAAEDSSGEGGVKGQQQVLLYIGINFDALLYAAGLPSITCLYLSTYYYMLQNH